MVFINYDALELLTDFRELTKKIEVKLIERHESKKEEVQSEIERIERDHLEKQKNQIDEKKPSEQEENQTKTHLPPFAKIIEVKENSPAHDAGLEVGDEIVQYGAANSINHSKLSLLLEITRDSVGSSISVLVKRGGAQIDLTVKPGPWSGPGILGCRFNEL